MTLSVLERGGLSLHGGALRDDGASLYLRKDAQVVQYGDHKSQGMLTLAAIGNPGTPTITPVGTAGSTTYGYKIVATVAGEDSAASAEGTTATGNATLSSTNYNEVTWSQVLGATGYKVYRTTGGATQGLISTITDGGVTTLNDTGLAGGGETASSANSTGCLVLGNGKGIRTGKTASDAFLLQVYDVDGAVWTTFITGTAGNTPSLTIANATMSGTWLASGTVTLPAVTMGDTIIITNGKFIKGSADDGSWSLVAGLNATYYDSNIWLYGSTHSTKPGSIELRTYSGGTPGTASGVLRLTLAGNAATVAATWNATYHVGLKHGLAGTATGAFTMDGATSGVVTVKVSDVAGTWTMTLPAAVGTAGYFLVDAAGDGITSWSNTLPAVTLGGDLDINAKGGLPVHLGFYQDNVAATQTAVALLIQGDAARVGYPAYQAGSVIGIVVYSNEARTAGSLTVDATIDGTVTGLQAVLDVTNPSVKATVQAKDTDAFTAGQLIGVKITTSADWTPTTADILVMVIVEC